MANLSSWFQRIIPLSPSAAQAAAEGASQVVQDRKLSAEQQVASADAASVGKPKKL